MSRSGSSYFSTLYEYPLARPDRDDHVRFTQASRGGLSSEDTEINENMTLTTNYDIDSIMQYPNSPGMFNIESTNQYYNLVGFTLTNDLTPSDKIRLNILYQCPSIKRKILRDFLHAEMNRAYVELMDLRIKPNEKSLK